MTPPFINEADVEVKFAYPLLTEKALLGLPSDTIKPKDYLAPTMIDKRAGKGGGYYPDYSVWMHGHPVLVAEVKDTDVALAVGYREALLYARHLNAKYPSGLNPCRFVLATNGVEVAVGVWDQDDPVLTLKASEISPGTAAVERLRAFVGRDELDAHAQQIFSRLKVGRGYRPYVYAGGQALLASKKPLNTFAADLSPILRRYFSSTGEEHVKEIIARGYVSSSEITEYDRVLEALLKDRAAPRRDTPVQPLSPERHNEQHLTNTLRSFNRQSEKAGQLQIIQGGVGSGKSLFARRYHEALEPEDLKNRDYWSFIDFNNSPASLKGAEDWLCEQFIESFIRENPSLDLFDNDVAKGVFSKKIQRRRSYYEQMRSISATEETRVRADDIQKWQDEPVTFADGASNYITGVIGTTLIVVMDNVDKLQLENQLDAFQLTLWFMSRSRAFVILQMRDETYERYKNQPPLDTYRSGLAFHISPPRFIDVVKRRLELGIEYLGNHAKETREYTLENGARVKLPPGELGTFLTSLYGAVFGHRTNVARLLEALAGRDVRRALEMFVSLVTSGHLSTSAITSTAIGRGGFRITEHNVIKILMRTDYRFFSEENDTGFVSNALYYSNDWLLPDNFLIPEILYFLTINRKQTGELGLEGYFSVERVVGEVAKLGYEPEDVLLAINHILRRKMIIADNFNFTEVSRGDSIKILASGFMHLRVLCHRIEYVYGILPTTPINDQGIAEKLASYVQTEAQREVGALHKAKAVRELHKFLQVELARTRAPSPFFDSSRSGAAYVVEAIGRSLDSFFDESTRKKAQDDQLDLL